MPAITKENVNTVRALTANFVERYFVGVALALSLIMGVFWYRAEQNLRPPNIEGWNWSEHPRTLVINVAGVSGCACMSEVVPSVRKALDASGEVVVTGDPHAVGEIDLSKFASNKAVHVVSYKQVGGYVGKNFKRSQLLWVVNGQIAHRIQGSEMPDRFLTPQ